MRKLKRLCGYIEKALDAVVLFVCIGFVLVPCLPIAVIDGIITWVEGKVKRGS